jgi:hypothetical protein
MPVYVEEKPRTDKTGCRLYADSRNELAAFSHLSNGRREGQFLIIDPEVKDDALALGAVEVSVDAYEVLQVFFDHFPETDQETSSKTAADVSDSHTEDADPVDGIAPMRVDEPDAAVTGRDPQVDALALKITTLSGELSRAKERALMREFSQLEPIASGLADEACARADLAAAQAMRDDPELAELADEVGGDPQEEMARKKGLTYVKLDGDIGVFGNGAGLCMSTLDVVAQAGGRPANFLDAGGGARAEEIIDALEVITSDPKVKTILFNIFGGITRGDEVARGIIEATERTGIELPMVVRLDGTHSEEGLALLAESGIGNLHHEKTMLGAAEKVVELTNGTTG